MERDGVNGEIVEKKFIENRAIREGVVLKIKANKHVLINCEITLDNYFMVNDCGMIVFVWYTNVYVDPRSHIYIRQEILRSINTT